ncbi:MAG TPA: hypothetical protein VFA18_09050 [Gemmataceae bacterium]|nr:hypothetical protein [Gemmataceae bacterium]
MDLDDFIEPEVAIAVAVTAAVATPPVRKALRKGAVYGLAGLMVLGDRLSTMARSAADKAGQITRSGAAGHAGAGTETAEHAAQAATS